MTARIANPNTFAITTARPESRFPGGGRIMLLTKTSESVAAAGPRLRRLAGVPLPTLDRRTFLKRSGLIAGAGAFASQLPYGVIGKADAAAEGASKVEVKRTVCTHCSVGGAIDAVVE